MKTTILTNGQLLSYYLTQGLDHARTANGSLSFKGKHLFTYDTLLAVQGFVSSTLHVTSEPLRQTSSKHRSMLCKLANHKHIIQNTEAELKNL